MEKEKKSKKIAVTKTANAGEAVLVMWQDGHDLKRAYIPAVEFVNGVVDEAVLEAAIPNPDDLEWSLIQTKPIKPVDLQNKLRSIGVWTAADLGRNIQAASLGLLELGGANLAALLEFANKEA